LLPLKADTTRRKLNQERHSFSWWRSCVDRTVGDAYLGWTVSVAVAVSVGPEVAGASLVDVAEGSVVDVGSVVEVAVNVGVLVAVRVAVRVGVGEGWFMDRWIILELCPRVTGLLGWK
jgi:hypothetical protein